MYALRKRHAHLPKEDHCLRKDVLLELLDGAKSPARRLKGPADRVEEAKTRRHG